jgi:chemotaxis protein methyltransferase CheR
LSGAAQAGAPLATAAEPRDRITHADYERLAALILSESGIRLGVEKTTMLEIRVRRRLKALGMDSYAQYCAYLFGPRGSQDEIVSLIDVVSTNKTDFFREPKHFDFLTQQVLPEWSSAHGASGSPYLVWSAGCSSGEEPYTLGIVLSEYAHAHPGLRFHILASDISTIVLEKAGRGIYSDEVTQAIPSVLKRKYFLRSRDTRVARVKVGPELRSLIEFRRLNFMDADYELAEHVDAIFFRNVMIYFDRATQERILSKLCAQLLPGGYLFVGHSETLHNMRLPVEPVAPSLYRRIEHGQ